MNPSFWDGPPDPSLKDAAAEILLQWAAYIKSKRLTDEEQDQLAFDILFYFQTKP